MSLSTIIAKTVILICALLVRVMWNIIDLEDLISNMGKKKSILEEMKKVIEALNEKIKRIIKILNGFRDFIKKFYEINNKIVSNYNVERINYQFYKT